MDRIVDNVRLLYETYGSKIKTDKHLLLLYWQKVDKVDVTKTGLSTVSWLEYSTNVDEILAAHRLYKILKDGND